METTIEEMLILIKRKVAEQGAYDREAYSHIVCETINYFKERGKLGEDENEDYIEKTLIGMYNDVRDGFLETEN